MKKYFLLPFLYVLCSMFYVSEISADSSVKINEFQIDISPQSVELVNLGSSPVDISSWYVDDSGGSSFFTIPQGTQIQAGSCVTFSSDFNLNKSSSDTIRLFDSSALPTTSSAVLKDSFGYLTAPGQNNSYSRSPDGTGTWSVKQVSLGAWNDTGISCLFVPTPQPSATPTDAAGQITESSSTTTAGDVQKIYLSEVMPNPLTGQSEWVELYNDNDSSITLQNWYIDDVENEGSSPRIFSATIQSKQYTVVEFSSSLFNNDGDSVRLLNNNKTLRDSFEYGTSTQGKTFAKINIYEESVCLQEPSKGVQNTGCITKEETSTPIATQSTKSASTAKNTIKKPGLKPSSVDENNQKADVLGEADWNLKQQKPNSYLKNLPLFSLSCSILTIIFLLFKIKSAHAEETEND